MVGTKGQLTRVAEKRHSVEESIIPAVSKARKFKAVIGSSYRLQTHTMFHSVSTVLIAMHVLVNSKLDYF